MKYMENLKMNSTQAMIEYLLNKYLPYIILLTCLYFSIGIYNIYFYIIIGLVIFIDRFSSTIGRSMGQYDSDPDFKKRVDDSLED